MSRHAISILVLGVLAGCTAGESPQSCRYDITMMLDAGQYDAAIAKLNDASCASAYTAAEKELNLAAAYVGKAGFDFPTIVNDLTANLNSGAAGSSYEVFIGAVKNKATAANLDFLNAAAAHYNNIMPVGQTLASYCTATNMSSPATTTTQKDACFLGGVMQTVTSSIGVSMLLGGNVSAWTTPNGCADDVNDNTIADVAEATSCALILAGGGACAVPSGAGTIAPGTVQLTSSAGYGGTFRVATIAIGGAGNCVGQSNPPIQKLLTTTTPSTVMLTDGHCAAGATAYTPCTAGSANCYPCPVITADGNQTATSAISTMLNQGTGIMTATLPAGQQTDVQNAINDFKAQVCGSATCTVTDASIATFLTK